MAWIDNCTFLAVALLEAPLEVVHASLESVLEEHFGPGRFSFDEGGLDLSKVYDQRPPSGGAHEKCLALFEPSIAVGRTAMVPNMEDGWMTLVNVLATRISGQHLLLRSSEDESYPVTDLEVWRRGASVRYVGVLKEQPAWMFHERGDVLEFENPARYAKRRIRDRFDRASAFETLERVGWSLASSAFWETTRPAIYAFEQR